MAFLYSPCIPYPHFNKGIVYDRALFPGQHTHRQLGVGINETLSKEETVKVFHGHKFPVLEFPCNGINLIVVNPRPASL